MELWRNGITGSIPTPVIVKTFYRFLWSVQLKARMRWFVLREKKVQILLDITEAGSIISKEICFTRTFLQNPNIKKEEKLYCHDVR